MPSFSFGAEQLGQKSHGNLSSQIVHHTAGSQLSDGEVENSDHGINFSSRLKQFAHVQQLHRIRAKEQAQSRMSSASSAMVC